MSVDSGEMQNTLSTALIPANNVMTTGSKPKNANKGQAKSGKPSIAKMTWTVVAPHFVPVTEASNTKQEPKPKKKPKQAYKKDLPNWPEGANEAIMLWSAKSKAMVQVAVTACAPAHYVPEKFWPDGVTKLSQLAGFELPTITPSYYGYDQDQASAQEAAYVRRGKQSEEWAKQWWESLTEEQQIKIKQEAQKNGFKLWHGAKWYHIKWSEGKEEWIRSSDRRFKHRSKEKEDKNAIGPIPKREGMVPDPRRREERVVQPDYDFSGINTRPAGDRNPAFAEGDSKEYEEGKYAFSDPNEFDSAPKSYQDGAAANFVAKQKPNPFVL